MRRRALLRTATAATATVLAGCGGTGDESRRTDETRRTTGTRRSSVETPTTDAESPLELDDHELVRSNVGTPDELAKVVGTVANRGESTVETVVVAARFLGEDGTALDDSRADVADFAPGETWSFELTYPGVGEDARRVADYAVDVETDE